MISATQAPSSAPLKLTLRQWAPCIAMLLLSLLSYVDRSTLAILSPTILADLHLSALQYGYAVTAFSVCYMVSNPVWGFLIDHRGLFWTIVVAVVLWSLASGSHAFILSLTGMCIARGLLGFGEGATFPAGLSTVAQTLPPERRSFGLALAYSGGSLGAALTPLLITPIAVHHGWRSTFLLTGFLGLLWIAMWLLLRAVGLYHPRTHEEPAQPAAASRSFRERLNPSLFATVLLYGLGAAPLAFGLYATPLYLNRVLHVPQVTLGHLLWIPPAGWEAGYLFWGAVSDRRNARGAARPFGLFTLFSIAGFIVVLLPFAARTPWPVTATMTVFFLEMFIAGGFVVLSLADGVNTQRHNAGFLAGIAISSWALVTAILLPCIGHLFDNGLFTESLWLIAILPPIGTVLWKTLSSIPASNNKEIHRNPIN